MGGSDPERQNAEGARPYLYVVPEPTREPPLPTQDIPRLPVRTGIGPRRRIIVWAYDLVLHVTLSCGHTIYGEFARKAGASARCPMCAGCGPEFYVRVGRRSWNEIHRRARCGPAPLVDWYASRQGARRRLAELNGAPMVHVS